MNSLFTPTHTHPIFFVHSIRSIIIYSHDTNTFFLKNLKKGFHYMELLILKLSNDIFNVKLYTNIINDLFTIYLKILI